MVNRGWFPRHTVLSGSELFLNGTRPSSAGLTAGIGTTGFLDMRSSVVVGGCLSASDGSPVVGSMSQDPGCGAPGGQARVEVPAVGVRHLREFSQYDLFPNGAVDAGPAHPTHCHTAANTRGTGSTPAANTENDSYRGWRCNGFTDTSRHCRRHESPGLYDGVDYVCRGSAQMAAHRQICSSGGGDACGGALLAELQCDSTGDVIGLTGIAGNLSTTNTGPVPTPLPGSEKIPAVAGWDEL